MKLNLEDLNPGVFFPWPDEDPDSTKGITLRPLPIEELTMINETASSKKKKYRMGQVFVDVQINEKLRESLMWDYIIMNWNNLYDSKGKEIPCTKETKILLMGKHFKFAVFVADCLEKLGEFEEEGKESELKNSQKSQKD